MNETALWRAVIDRALNDARGQMAEIPPEGRDRHCAAALVWFQYARQNFRQVCEFAGLDPDWVRSAALEKINGEKHGLSQ